MLNTISQTVLLAITIIIAVSCGENDSEITLRLDPITIDIHVGKTQKVTAFPTQAGSPLPKISWRSSDEDIATIADDGTVTAIATGIAVIVAETSGYPPATCTVRVSTPDAYTLLMSEVKANGFRFKDGITYRIVDATNTDLAYIKQLLKDEELKRIGLILPLVTKIEKNEFTCYSALNSISLPVATTIGEDAFNSSDLTFIDIPSAIIIGQSAFNRCYRLLSANLPVASVIGERAFYGCENLKTVAMPDATVIGDLAFNFCVKLNTIDLPKATDIGTQTFSNCRELTSIHLPAVIKIGSRAFEFCKKLTYIDLPLATLIGNEIIYECQELNTLKLGTASTITTYYSFENAYNSNIDLYLGTGEINNATGNQWKGKNWKSISPYEQ